jgi:GAF domain-containing protein
MHADEADRQRALDLYRIVDSLPEEAYDDIARLAACLCGTPTALVSLIDRDRQWFKARLGFAASETRRDEAFCDHAIRHPGTLMEVPDARRDPRFVDNPLVTGDTAVRFYAGMPLVTPGGAAVGTVCVLDQTPRTLDPAQREALAALARLTMNLFESHRRERELQRAALFAAAAPVAEPSVTAAEPASDYRCTVAIVQVQRLDALSSRLGERALGRLLGDLDGVLAACIGAEDALDRSTGSGEFILLLHGDDGGARLRALAQGIAAFTSRDDLKILLASATSAVAGERIEDLFLRADAALSAQKDAAAA